MLEDEWDGTQHWGVVQSEGPVLVCSTWIDQQASEFPGLTMKRLRAMGTHPDFQQRGLGAQLIRHVEQLLRQTHDGMWCDAREAAVPFYEKCGWTIIHGPYEVPLIGTHFKMAKTWKGDKSSL
jgi:GNAT superfamily N-acetyltransferase